MSVPTAEAMTAADVIRLAEERGFQVTLKENEPPMPVLRGDVSQATPALLEVLRAFREEIIPILRQRAS